MSGVIIGAGRTPIGSVGGSLKDVGVADLGAVAVPAALRIARAAWTAIAAHARADAPLECCGLLIGADRCVARVVGSPNLDASGVRYTIDPHAYLRAAREARAERMDVIGAYHSHPTSPPRPSATDLAEGVDAPFVYVIAGPVVADRDPEIRAWEKVAGVFVELAVRVGDEG